MKAVLLIFFIIFNWVIYHKIFKVYYFGNMSKSLTNELIWCILGACFEVAVILTIGQKILGVFGWIIKIIVIIAIIIAVLFALKELYVTVKQVIDLFKRKTKKVKAEECSEKEGSTNEDASSSDDEEKESEEKSNIGDNIVHNNDTSK